MTDGEFYHHFTLYCDTRAIFELSLHTVTCLALALDTYMQENTLIEPTTSYKTEENGQVIPKKQQQTQV